MKTFWHSALSLILGFAGGIVATRVFPPKPPALINAGIIRAERFELADGPNLPANAYWGRDRSGGFVMAFLGANGKEIATFGVGQAGFTSKGPTALTPFISLSGEDGEPRFVVRVDRWGSPIVTLTNPRKQDSLYLGHIFGSDMSGDYSDPWDNWGLAFSKGSEDYAGIGVTTPLGKKVRTGYVILKNSRGQELWKEPK